MYVVDENGVKRVFECPVCFTRTQCPPCLGSGVVTESVVVGYEPGGRMATRLHIVACVVCAGSGLFHDLGMHEARKVY